MAEASEPAAAGEGWVFLVDKPADLSSFAIIRRVRRLLGVKKVGHAGTLDPFATGLLIVCAGRAATRHIERFMGGGKTYLARLQLGVETETLDPEGAITATAPVPVLDQAAIDACLAAHAGEQWQAPPAYSAVKHRGKPLYAYARQGVHIDKAPRPIVIDRLVCRGYDPASAQLDIEVGCSRGTYIRVLAADIGRSLGCGAHLISLRRTASGPFTVGQSVPGDALNEAGGREQLLAGRLAIDEALRLAGPGPAMVATGQGDGPRSKKYHCSTAPSLWCGPRNTYHPDSSEAEGKRFAGSRRRCPWHRQPRKRRQSLKNSRRTRPTPARAKCRSLCLPSAFST